jgi:hypothetical protein
MNLHRAEVPIVFAAGPTVRGHQPHLTSWRFEAIEEFERQGFDGILVVPEFTDRKESDKGKRWIPRWEFVGLKTSDAILLWVARTPELIGLTTSYEQGYWMGRFHEKVVYGRPDDAYRISYPDEMHQIDAEDRGYEPAAIYSTLGETIEASIDMARFRFFEGLRTPTLVEFENPYLNGSY